MIWDYLEPVLKGDTPLKNLKELFVFPIKVYFFVMSLALIVGAFRPNSSRELFERN